jgi:putative membrane protein
MELKRIFKSWLLIAIGVLIASHVFSGIHYEDSGALIVAVLLLSLCNVFLKPLLMLFALPFIVMTFGLGIWLINALLFLLVGNLVDGFVVDSFGSALAGAVVVSLTGLAANLLFGSSKVQVRAQHLGAGSRRSSNVSTPRAAAPDSQTSSRSRKSLDDDDEVIDI